MEIALFPLDLISDKGSSCFKQVAVGFPKFVVGNLACIKFIHCIFRNGCKNKRSSVRPLVTRVHRQFKPSWFSSDVEWQGKWTPDEHHRSAYLQNNKTTFTSLSSLTEFVIKRSLKIPLPLVRHVRRDLKSTK